MKIEDIIIRILVAAACGGLLGTDRLRKGRAAGIRTHAILCMGSALTVIVGICAFELYGNVTDPVRIAAQVISGVGFLGIGTIIVKGRNEITGLTTAATLWTTAAIGLSIGLGMYPAGIIATAVAFGLISFVSRAEMNLKIKRRTTQLYIETDSVEHADIIIDKLKDAYRLLNVDVTAPRSAVAGNVGIEFQLNNKENNIDGDIRDSLKFIDEHVLLVLEAI